PPIRAQLLYYATQTDFLDDEQRAELREYLSGLCTTPEQAELWLEEARYAAASDNIEAAVEALHRVLAIAPGQRRALHMLATLAWQSGDIEGATRWLSHLASVTTHRPFRAALELEIGLLKDAVLARPSDALIHYERALEATPSDPTLLHF